MSVFSPGCNCCCKDDCTFSDSYDEQKTGYYAFEFTGSTLPSFIAADGKLQMTGATGSYSRQIEVGRVKHQRISVEARCTKIDGSSKVGIFIGGVASMWLEGNTLKRAVNCDSKGEGGDVTTIGLVGYTTGLFKILVDQSSEATGDDAIYDISFWVGGNVVDYETEFSVTISSPIYIGLFGEDAGEWDDLCIVANHNAQVCDKCCGCPSIANGGPRSWLLSVPDLTDGESCTGCESLSGDFVLRRRQYWDRACSPSMIGCGFFAMEEFSVTCGEVCPTETGVAWMLSCRLNDNRVLLECNNRQNVLVYSMSLDDFDCTAANTLTYSCTVCGNSCSHPSTLTIIPQF